MTRAPLLLVLLASHALAWGFDGHRALAARMQDPLPAQLCLRQWLTAAQTPVLQDSACNPDRWRYPSAGADYDPSEWPNHYLEIDWTNPLSSYPRTWSAVQQRFGSEALGNGRVPWRVEEMTARLVEDFRSKDTARILTTAFLLSHYVTDAFSVLHDTRNYDPNGLHSRWESDMLAVSTRRTATALLAATFYGTPGRADARNAIFDIVQVGNGQVETLIGFDSANPVDLDAFFAASKELTARRWGDALTLLSSLIWTAWADAGAPELSGFSASCSRAVPAGEVVLLGFPVPGGFTHPVNDADAGAGGGGAAGGAGGAGGGAGAGAGGAGGAGAAGGAGTDGGEGGGGAAPQVACGCTTSASSLPLALALVAAVLRRRGVR